MNPSRVAQLVLTESIGWCRSYDHETDPEYERMQQAENFILSRYQQLLPADSADSKP